MKICKGINFDNTLSVREFAKTDEAKKILNEVIDGKEQQLYKVGDIVSGDGLGFNEGTIIEIYSQCGYFYYVVEYKLKPRARKTFKQTLRTKDIVLKS